VEGGTYDDVRLASSYLLLRAGGEATSNGASEFRRYMPICLLVVCPDGVCHRRWIFGEEMTLRSYLMLNCGVAATSFVLSVPVSLLRWLQRRVKK
jgi:hypothetical protein